VVIATLVWLIATCSLFYWGFDLDLSGEPRSPEERADADSQTRLLIGVFVAGPVLVSVVALVVEMPRTALVFFVLALVLACFNGSQQHVRDLFNPPPVEVEVDQPGNGHCVPISGSDRTCPGG
jgi:hypothetical protein